VHRPRGGHTRDDFPGTSEEWGTRNIVLTATRDYEIQLKHQPLPVMPAELQELFEEK
jgi:succinate dehydrogenase / fumarate reductase flavoprotein subunit